MPCGRVSRSQFASQSEYEAHRAQMMKLILGDDWTDQPLSKLVQAHPELRRLTLQELIAVHEGGKEDSHELPGAASWHAEAMQPEEQRPGTWQSPADGLQAIEGGERRQTAEDWLRNYLREHDGSERED